MAAMVFTFLQKLMIHEVQLSLTLHSQMKKNQISSLYIWKHQLKALPTENCLVVSFQILFSNKRIRKNRNTKTFCWYRDAFL